MIVQSGEISEKYSSFLLIWRLISFVFLFSACAFFALTLHYKYNLTISMWVFYLSAFNSIILLINSIYFRRTSRQVNFLILTILYKVVVCISFTTCFIFWAIFLPYLIIERGGISHEIQNFDIKEFIINGIIMHSLPFLVIFVDLFFINILIKIVDFLYTLIFLVSYLI